MRAGVRGHLRLLPDLRTKAISLLPLSLMLAVGVFVNTCLTRWGSSPLFWICWGFFFNHKKGLNFVKCLFLHLLRWKCGLSFLLKIVYYMDWFAHVESTLNSWDKSSSILVFNPFPLTPGLALLVNIGDCLYLWWMLACSFLFLWCIFDFKIIVAS